jgi:hypothetical protein
MCTGANGRRSLLGSFYSARGTSRVQNETKSESSKKNKRCDYACTPSSQEYIFKNELDKRPSSVVPRVRKKAKN